MLLGVVAILGVLGVVALLSFSGGGGGTGGTRGLSTGETSTSAARSGPGPKSTSASGPGALISAAAVVTCRTDYQAVVDAVGYYQTENGKYPPDLAALRPWLKGPVSSPYFTIRLDPHQAGAVDVGTKGHPPGAGDGNCAFAA